MSNAFQENANGGFSFSSPSFSFGTTTPAVNSGYSFDLPIATMQSFANQALNFSAQNSSANRGFLGNSISGSQFRVDQAVERNFAFQEIALGRVVEISQDIGSTTRYVAKKRSKSGFCFITTAICASRNLPDDCEELRIMRQFRDNIEKISADYAYLVGQYYSIAPDIVQNINSQENAEEIYEALRVLYLNPILKAIENGEINRAVGVYTEMVRTAKGIGGK